MSLNRLMYDQCASVQQYRQSTEPLEFILDPNRFERCSKCRPELGIVGGTQVSHVAGNLVDLESSLRGQTNPLTHCPSHKHIPNNSRFIEDKRYNVTNKINPIDTQKKHLKPCQMFDYQGVPFPQPIVVSNCLNASTSD